MASLATHTTNRNAAGAAYALAAKNVVDAWVELQALDQISNNSSVAASSANLDGTGITAAFVMAKPGTQVPGEAPSGRHNGFPQAVGTFNSTPNLPYHVPFLASGAADAGTGAVVRSDARFASLYATYAHGRLDLGTPTENAARATNRSTIAGLRATAGATYAAAVTALASAYIELAAYDMTLANGFVGGGIQPSFSSPFVVPAHRDFVPSPPAGPMGDQIRTRFLQILAS